MIAICIEAIDNESGRVVIQADTAPETMPTTGEGIDGLRDDYQLAPGSILLSLSTSKAYILGETGTWYAWG